MRAAVAIALGASASVLAIGLVVTGGCLRTTQFQCTKDSQCVNAGVHGRCEAVGFCSFPDMDCESGLRFGEINGSQSSQCVPVDAGVIDTPELDMGIDGVGVDARECFGAGAYELCFNGMPPMGTVALSGALDTTSDARCATLPASWVAAGEADACLITGQEIDVNGALTVTGTRPLLLVGDTVKISAAIDIASHRGGATAAGANATQCSASASAPTAANTGAGGGAGGSFMTTGGNGGAGDSATQTGGGAAAADAAAPTILRGGCPGEGGGMGTAAAGAAGPGGGAIYIAAGTFSMTSAAVINASGAGGAAGGAFSGGSGGGSGGMIVIYASALGTTTGGKLVANGGGAAAGGNSNPGVAGSDPNPATLTTPAAGGTVSGSNGGSNGGAGFAGTTAAKTGLGPSNNKGGGGGGGGGGYIQVNVALPGVTASPAVTVVP